MLCQKALSEDFVGKTSGCLSLYAEKWYGSLRIFRLLLEFLREMPLFFNASSFLLRIPFRNMNSIFFSLARNVGRFNSPQVD